MIFSRQMKRRFVPILVNRLVFLFFMMCLLTLFLYAAGTVQGFIDSTQLALLEVCAIFVFFLASLSFYGLFLNIARFLRIKRKRYLLRAAGYLFFVLFAAVTFLVVMFIITLSKGIGAA